MYFRTASARPSCCAEQSTPKLQAKILYYNIINSHWYIDPTLLLDYYLVC